MLTEVCQYLRNWFTRAQYRGVFKIENGELQTQFDAGNEFGAVKIINGQYFRIINSALNDGVYKYPVTDLKDEEFDGAVWTMNVPPAVVSLCAEIEAWCEKYGGVDSAMLSPYQSESFGGYSYSKSNGGDADGANGVSWKTVFGARLAPWRKI